MVQVEFFNGGVQGKVVDVLACSVYQQGRSVIKYIIGSYKIYVFLQEIINFYSRFCIVEVVVDFKDGFYRNVDINIGRFIQWIKDYDIFGGFGSYRVNWDNVFQFFGSDFVVFFVVFQVVDQFFICVEVEFLYIFVGGIF